MIFRWLIPVPLAFALTACGEDTSDDLAGDIEPYLEVREIPYTYADGIQIRGKLVLVDLDNHSLDPMHDRLSDEIRTRNPGEVSTVGQITCVANETEKYGFLSTAYDRSCNVTLFDAKTGEVLVDFGRTAAPPCSVYFPFWDRYASRPNRNMLQEIEGLPRNP